MSEGQIRSMWEANQGLKQDGYHIRLCPSEDRDETTPAVTSSLSPAGDTDQWEEALGVVSAGPVWSVHGRRDETATRGSSFPVPFAISVR